MKKLFLIVSLLTTIPFIAQTISKSKDLFGKRDDLTSFSFMGETSLMLQFQKYYNSSAPFSIYNPKPGFNPTKINPQNYYSFVNTNSLLKREMSNIKPEPIFPDQNDKKTFGEAVFYGLVDGIFNKK